MRHDAGREWTFDDGYGAHFAQHLLAARERERRLPAATSLRWRRRISAVANRLLAKLPLRPSGHPSEDAERGASPRRTAHSPIAVLRADQRSLYHSINRIIPGAIKQFLPMHELERLLPRSLTQTVISAGHDRAVEHEYFVLVGHTKAELDFDAIAAGLRQLRLTGIELRSLTELAQLARTELGRETHTPSGSLDMNETSGSPTKT